MDSSIGQGVFDQAQPFKQSVSVGVVIVTKTDGHAKGGGVARSQQQKVQCYLFELESALMSLKFLMSPFVSRLVGMGDWSGFMKKIHEVVPTDQQSELLQRLSRKICTLRDFFFKRVLCETYV